MVAARFLLFISAGLGFRGRTSGGLAGIRSLLAIGRQSQSKNGPQGRGYNHSLGRGLEVDHKFRAFARSFAESADGTVVQFHDRLADRQTEAEPLATSAGLCEGVEDFFEIFRFNPNAGVADLDLQSLRLRVEGPHRDGAAFRSEFRSVPQDIPKYLLQPRGVCEDMMIGCEQLDGNIELPRG